VFTGIVEAVGSVAGLRPGATSTRIEIEAPGLAGEVAIGDSVAVSGACLTVAAASGTRMSFDAVAETLVRTSLGALRVGARVNLERALRAGARLDGHIVQGHVDGTGTVRALERAGDDVRLHVDFGPEVADYLVDKGSVAIDGVSLTVVSARPDGFDVALIPHTLAVTTLGEKRPGDRVNLEADVLGKYVRRYLEKLAPGSAR
jgi:riboflavin synthase